MIVPTYETTAREQEIIINNQRKEIERLNNIIKQQQEDIEEYNDKLNEVVKERNKYLHIINEFDKWLLGEKMMFYKGSDGETLIRYGETKNKWLELKGSDKE